jgi:predicted permease
LLLARATARAKEFALRISLGASRGRLLRQLLTESLVLAGAGALLGLGLAYIATWWLTRQGSMALPLMNEVRVDSVVLAWTIMIAVIAGLLFGIAPGLRVSAGNLSETLKESGPGTSSGRKHERLRAVLVVSEVALACVLIVGAGLLLRSFLHVMDVDLGFLPSQSSAINIEYTAPVDFKTKDTFTKTIAQRNANLRDILQQVSSVAGVEAAGVTDNLPLLRNRSWDGPVAKGKTYPKDYYHDAFIYMISPGYFRAIGMRLHGRDFAWSDDPASQSVIILNKAAAQGLWPNEDAVGRVAVLQGKDQLVIGVIDEVHGSNIEGNPGWQMYLPLTQWGGDGNQLVVKSSLPPAQLAPGIMHVLRQINPGQPLTELKPMQSVVDHATSPRRFFAVLVDIFAMLGLLLASLGIYGVISYSVTRQTQEIGIRMALGATRQRVQFAVISATLRMTLLGVAIGTGAALVVARGMSSLLFQTQSTDPITFGGTIALLSAVALIAGYLPAQRASHIDPMTALRSN